ncbi:hypothetical protein [Thermogutta sp.]|uniref:hypothetical protein n=1 Tax=Thermogutta sp. TaxID=1962930 RepID=UPI00321FB7DC
MSVLVKRIKKEFRKHPAKAVLLGVLCVVAFFLWGPKMLGRRPATENGGTFAPSASILATSILMTKQTGEEGQNAQLSVESVNGEKWREVAKWRRANLAALALPSDLRDPFSAVTMESGTAQAKGVVTAESSLAVIQSMIHCTGVVITPKRRWVILDNKSLEEGSELTLRHKGSECRIHVVKVYADKVIFEINGRTLEYNITKLGIVPDRSQL